MVQFRSLGGWSQPRDPRRRAGFAQRGLQCRHRGPHRNVELPGRIEDEHAAAVHPQWRIVGPHQQPVMRDLYFRPTGTLSEYTRLAERDGAIPD